MLIYLSGATRDAFPVRNKPEELSQIQACATSTRKKNHSVANSASTHAAGAFCNTSTGR